MQSFPGAGWEQGEGVNARPKEQHEQGHSSMKECSMFMEPGDSVLAN